MSDKEEIAQSIQAACKNDDVESLRKILLKNPKLSEEPLNSVFLIEIISLATEQSGEIFDLLVNFIESGAEHSLEKQLIIAIFKSDVKLAEILLENGADVRGKEWYDLLEFVYQWIFEKKNFETRKEMLTLLLKNGQETHYRKRDFKMSPLTLFCDMVDAEDHDAPEIAKILINYGAPINELYNEPLHAAVSSQNVPLISFFLEHGLDVNFKDSLSCTPLFHAHLSNDCAEVFELLVSYGADVNVRISNEYTLLHHGCLLYEQQYITHLLKNGADVSAKTKYGETPLSLLLRSKNAESKSEIKACLRAVVKEFSKLSFDNIPIIKDDTDLIKKTPEALKIFEVCTSELNEMSSTKFYGSYSYYSLLKMSKNKLANLTKNEKFLQKFQENLHRFPNFKNDLEYILKKVTLLRDNM